MTQNELHQLAEAAKREGVENRERLAHNSACVTEATMPYDNAAWLRYAGHLRRLIREKQKARSA